MSGARETHEAWGTGWEDPNERRRFYPTLCGLSPIAHPSTTKEPAQVTCPGCRSKREALVWP